MGQAAEGVVQLANWSWYLDLELELEARIARLTVVVRREAMVCDIFFFFFFAGGGKEGRAFGGKAGRYLSLSTLC
jgi:hypothetical protein